MSNTQLSQNIADKKILELESSILSPKRKDKHAPARYFSESFTVGFGVYDESKRNTLALKNEWKFLNTRKKSTSIATERILDIPKSASQK